MTRRNYSNTAVATTLSAGISASDTSLGVASAAGHPAAPFTIKIGSEVILVGAKSGTTYSSLVRGYDGTTAAIHASGAAVEHVGTAADVGLGWGGAGAGTVLDNTNWHTVASSAYEQGLNNGRNRMSVVPLVVSRRCEITAFGFFLTSTMGASCDVHMGIYDSLIDGYPGALLSSVELTAAEWSASLLAGMKSKALGTPYVLEPGFYWLALYAEGVSGTDLPCWGSAGTSPYMPHDAGLGSNNGRRNGYQFTAGALTALPNPFPSGQTLTDRVAAALIRLDEV